MGNMGIRRSGGAVAWAVAGAMTLSGCEFLVPEGEGEPGPTPTPAATRSAPPRALATGVPEAAPVPTPTITEAATPSCPASGVTVHMDSFVDGAMGLRATSVQLTNCGKKPYRITDHPAVEVLDKDHGPRAVTVRLRPATHDFPRLDPGERATASLTWRVAVAPGSEGSGAYLRIAPAPRQESWTFEVMTELGDGAMLEVSPWDRLPS